MPLPWNAVNDNDAHTIAQLIGLPKRERSERRKWGCPFCGSSDALHAYPGNGKGFGCWAACGADQRHLCKGYSIVDVAARHWAIRPADACRRLAAQLGISCEDTFPSKAGSQASLLVPAARPRMVQPSQQEANLAAVRALPGARLPSVLYTDLVTRLRLTFRGARYLTGRGLDAGAARKYGFRSIDSAAEWTAIGRYLQRTYIREELAAAGFPLAADAAGQESVTLPWNGRLPALLIPFHRSRRLVGLRFRNTLPDNPEFKHNRYRTLAAAKPPWPYNADALRARRVHVTEGEMDAEAIRQQGEHAAGKYSAGIWLSRWTGELAHADEIVDWHDCNDPKHAGHRGAKAFRTELIEAFGEEWVARRLRRMITDADPSALHAQGRLEPLLRAKPWASASIPEVYVA